MPAEFESREAFYADRPERERSLESDYGVHWSNGRISWPYWRVSYAQVTGEIYAEEQKQGGAVKLLGVFPPDQEGLWYASLDRLLEGWAERNVSRFKLSWVIGRLRDRARIERALFPQPAAASAAADVAPFMGLQAKGWTHPDPGGICTTTAHRHRSQEAAQGCEYRSRVAVWRARLAEYRASASQAESGDSVACQRVDSAS